jgi:hypothetical protein
MFFGKKACKHSFGDLVVLKDSTAEYNDDYKAVTHHLHCLRCGKDVDMKYVKYVDDSWFKRKEEYVV